MSDGRYRVRVLLFDMLDDNDNPRTEGDYLDFVRGCNRLEADFPGTELHMTAYCESYPEVIVRGIRHD